VRGFVLIPLTATTLVLGACSLLVSTSGLDDGASDAVADGGDNDASMAPLVESGSDGVAPVIPPISNDAATDGAKVDPTTVSPCSATHVFCDDFDTGSADVATRWSSSQQSAGPITIDSFLPRSPPRGLHLALTSGMGNRASELRKELSLSSKAFHYSVDTNIATPSSPSYGEVDILDLQFSPPPSGYSFSAVSVDMYPDRTTFEYYATTGPTDTLVQPTIMLPHNTWVHLDIDVDFNPSPATATLKIDGGIAATINLIGDSLSSVSMGLGATYTNNAGVTWDVAYDNIFVSE
jgi:hypothetical protein